MNVLTGINAPPWLTGLTRAIIIAVAYAVINAAIIFFTNTTDEQLLLYQVPILGLLRFAEGLLDQWSKPKSNESPPMVEGS